MTGLEIILIVIIWVIVGVWISYKRNWYHGLITTDFGQDDRKLFCWINAIFSPIALLMAFYREFINSDWKKTDEKK